MAMLDKPCHPNAKDLTGQKYGRLTVLGEAPGVPKKSGHLKRMWYCRCDCGVEKIVSQECLTRKKYPTISCGCYALEKAREVGHKYGVTHGGTNERLYGIWSDIKTRCYNSMSRAYKYYGARGITMCDEWRNNYESFKEWAMSHGYNPQAPRGKCTIDRIDVNGNYEPNNCRWVDMFRQANNTRSNVHYDYNGAQYTIREISMLSGISYSLINSRLSKGWSIEEAITIPYRMKRREYYGSNGVNGDRKSA